CLVVAVLALRPRGGASIGFVGIWRFWSVCYLRAEICLTRF
ncbi:hypothetical protein A2U01_0071321, partial [Trifolium medium]|nr:hypothetical protein [Trifolium medium]